MLILNRCETSRFEPLNPAKRPIALPSHTWPLIPVMILFVFIIPQPINSCSHASALDISSFLESTTYQVMPPKGKLSRKKATREGHKTTVKRIAYEVNEQLEAATVDVTCNLDKYKQAPNVSKLRQQRESLRTKLGTLNV